MDEKDLRILTLEQALTDAREALQKANARYDALLERLGYLPKPATPAPPALPNPTDASPNPEPAGLVGPKLTQPTSVHDSMADLLGFPKEGR